MKSEGSHLRLIRGGKDSAYPDQADYSEKIGEPEEGSTADFSISSVSSAASAKAKPGDPNSSNDLSDLLSDKGERGLARYLAIRERAPVEVRQYLGKKGILKSWHDSILERLQQMDLLNEERFCRIRIEHRLRSGQGPRRIQQELGSLGVDRHTASDCLNEIASHQWEESCLAVAEEKLKSIIDREDSVSRLLQFLNYRGFESAHIDWALGSLKESHPDWARGR
ncbi:MAG: regulatory protein RecX [Leptospiraceae bacterium]|nr:regulatory protein RecX [Leptospiraceae bacterium]